MNHLIEILIIILFSILGIQLLRSKWLFLIAGFNMLSTKEKEQINTSILSKIVGTFSLFVALLQLISLYQPNYNQITTALIFLSLIVTIILSHILAKKASKKWFD